MWLCCWRKKEGGRKKRKREEEAGSRQDRHRETSRTAARQIMQQNARPTEKYCRSRPYRRITGLCPPALRSCPCTAHWIGWNRHPATLPVFSSRPSRSFPRAAEQGPKDAGGRDATRPSYAIGQSYSILESGKPPSTHPRSRWLAGDTTLCGPWAHPAKQACHCGSPFPVCSLSQRLPVAPHTRQGFDSDSMRLRSWYGVNTGLGFGLDSTLVYSSSIQFLPTGQYARYLVLNGHARNEAK